MSVAAFEMLGAIGSMQWRTNAESPEDAARPTTADFPTFAASCRLVLSQQRASVEPDLSTARSHALDRASSQGRWE